ncbi:P-loop containing nucleoside triphosphate hydrolase protein [Aspergillus germanicus]
MADYTASQTRSARLSKVFSLILSGKRLVTTADNFMLLLESVQDQTDHAACVERIIASSPARNALHAGLRFNTKPDFLNEHTSSFIIYLMNSTVKALCNGQFLRELFELIVEPCTVWNALMQAFQNGQLTGPATHAFAWLLVELLTLSSALRIDVTTNAQQVVKNGSLLRSPSPKTRELGEKLERILQIQSTTTTGIADLEHIPDGRHDNDHADFRHIAIYLTSDEFRSKEKPFYRRVDEVIKLPLASRTADHLDNQFRLLRDDMLFKMREEFQIACGKRKKARTITMLLGPDGRNDLLQRDKGYLRHQSFGCLLRDQEIVSFATVDRQVDFLLEDPPQIVLRVIGEEAVKKTLSYFKLYDDIHFFFVDAPKVELPLAPELLEHLPGAPVALSHIISSSVPEQINDQEASLQEILGAEMPITLDPSQRESMLWPPGTGKSFVGALLGMALYKHSTETILVMCYTNHALDQFLEDLLDIGIDSTASLSLFAQQFDYSHNSTIWSIIDELKNKVRDLQESFAAAFAVYRDFRLTPATVMEFLEFEEPEFFEAFTPPEQEDGKHHSMPSIDHLGTTARGVWDMDTPNQTAKAQVWTQKLLDEHVSNVRSLISRHDQCQAKFEKMWIERTREILRSKRIIGCTTTAAAGEILESHVLVAMGSKTKQLIMIGDNKQLRPKINNYSLSVEKGSGYDLNQSLFERLVGSGYPHCTLLNIACTLNRPSIRGLQDRDTFREVSDRHDASTNGSKRNAFEAHLVPNIVRYLGQQGYGTNKLVVLTPYLGQLHLLRELLSKETNPVLNDLVSYDLVRAGLISHASAQHTKRPFRLSTIDNYQGEESDVVVATLTRSNEDGEIGFMSAPQRLNVLLSRARDILIMIGNSQTFKHSRKGQDIWIPLFDQLQANGHLYDGLSVRCEQHPQRRAVLRELDHFDELCPDGGCQQACEIKLNCGLHDCPHKCHQLSDHSKMQCHKAIEWTCSRDHQVTRPYKEIERRRKRDMELDAKREAQLKASTRELAQIEDEIVHERRVQKEQRDEQERQQFLQQHRDDLNQLRANTSSSPQKLSSTISKPNEPSSASSQPHRVDTNAKPQLRYQKESEGAKSAELDKLMSMIGLESIKLKFLAIKAQVDAALRQKIDFKEERFGSVLLGNPGTGKTTVARIYAKFLTSMGIIPGSHIEKTTGSRLANGGVSCCEKHINANLNKGGGVLFIDDAYQLAQGGMGSQVLDFLLAEIERLTGKVVVVLAGYRNQMEKFFAHNPGLPSRFQREFNINKKFRGRKKVEGGMGGLYCHIIARHISRQRGHEGFGNARTRQSKRLAEERRSKAPTDDLLLTKEDVIELQEMISLGTVKDTVRALLSIQTNYERELLEEPLIEFTLNRVFLGSPGTGKTTVAKLYGQILVDIGYLPNGEVVVKNPADFVGSVIGQSEQNTKGILASTVGKALVIDEAYGLFGGGTRDSAGTYIDPYKTAVVDTIVAEVQSVPGDNRCVLLLGYEEQMKRMFQNVNPGLSRRFPMDAAFVLSRGRNSPHFGNAGEIDNLLNGAKLRQQKRRSSAKKHKSSLSDLLPQVFDPDFDRGDSNETNIPMLFQGIVGCETIIKQLELYRQTVKNMRQLDMNPKEQVPFNFLFRGPPGTGKTSTARKMGKVYYDMNLLSSAEVIESSATDLIGQYIGHTDPKTQELLEKALGKVLLIDEAYQLAEGHFAKKAMDEIFKGLEPDDCIELLINLLRSKKNKISARLDSFCLKSHYANWANARDVQTLAKAIFGTAIQPMQGKVVVITEDLVTDKLDDMISGRTTRSEQIFCTAPSTAAPSVKDIAETADPALPVDKDKTETCPAGTPRDDGVSDEIWDELQQDLQSAEREESNYQSLLENECDAQKAVDNITSLPEDDSNLDDDAKGLHEQRRLEDLAARADDEAKRQHERRRLEELALRTKLEESQRKREAKEAERREEQRAQQKLRQMGVCCTGYRWIKQASGYRCAGGSHYVSNVDLGV